MDEEESDARFEASPVVKWKSSGLWWCVVILSQHYMALQPRRLWFKSNRSSGI